MLLKYSCLCFRGFRFASFINSFALLFIVAYMSSPLLRLFSFASFIPTTFVHCSPTQRCFERIGWPDEYQGRQISAARWRLSVVSCSPSTHRAVSFSLSLCCFSPNQLAVPLHSRAVLISPSLRRDEAHAALVFVRSSEFLLLCGWLDLVLFDLAVLGFTLFYCALQSHILFLFPKVMS